MHKYQKSQDRGKPRVFEVSSVSEFVEVATWMDSSFIFRGQTKEKGWPLIPSVGRFVEGSRVPWREREILGEFRREAIRFLQVVPSNDWQWLALAQHNRLPTRLLDWTRNPLAALWFAVSSSAIEEKPGLVWAYIYEEADVVSNTEGLSSPFSIDRLYVYYPEHVFPFIQAQSGVFTAHYRCNDGPGKFPPIEEIKDADLRLTKIEIPAKSFPTVRYQLFRVGISPASLFPGLQGLVERIRYDNMLSEDEKKVYSPPNSAAQPDDYAAG
jgi:FRG domain